ncbi:MULTISPECIES: hypothetical protein [Aminobacter]|jgi:hypothetical protein|uniref:Nucleoside-specific outer membrane channel protein Tsx n=2 Tax=Aminobacter TaxID=31988 RepID=A0AAC8YTB9_AMIAI|nr:MULTISPECIES: hypothetical protein [Aminobacter]AMS44155.1 hypothetical protein AA2016_5249 [Aminobacter aminovorans]MBA8910698.1 nucleoside-specific outer membrane channel protein Tsx [Aminobacter ciceronei]MBA9024464.1 nucleoside-specific outer membrane channel protein Tsx [Aminobacter ciceronei]MBB3705453.1 nucleoside-specific outer membrane channel protein Tsx [Aminobacter aminovorans]MRX37596.1 DUF680 domain-containing protein [Aminobacter sp. MDW-2]
MRRTILALAALAATSDFAMANDTTKTTHKPTMCSQTVSGEKVDCGSTGSTRDDRGPATTNSIGAKKPRVGIDINPWIVPTFN